MSGVPQAEVDFDHLYPAFSMDWAEWVLGEIVTTREPSGGRWRGRVEFAAGQDAVVVVEEIDDRLAEVSVKVGDKILYKGSNP
jgi:hypothetical protein